MNEDKKRANAQIYDNEVSITPSGYFGIGAENIVALENFMTDEEKQILYNFAVNNKDWDYTEDIVDDNGIVIYDSSYWKDRVASSTTLHTHAYDIAKLIEKLQARLKVEVDKFFNIDAFASGPTIVKWNVGQYQFPHADKELHKYEKWGGSPEKEGIPNDFPHYDIAGLFYINDDYEGGELYFPEQNIQFKPKAGAAYFFPGDKNYIHGVTEITKGTRYTCPFFWTIKTHYNEDGSVKDMGGYKVARKLWNRGDNDNE
jgi:hypothetical protein